MENGKSLAICHLPFAISDQSGIFQRGSAGRRVPISIVSVELMLSTPPQVDSGLISRQDNQPCIRVSVAAVGVCKACKELRSWID
jgi:hypothetical protein